MIITRSRFHDHKTKTRIHEHLANKGDVISEEDIRNAKTDDFDKELDIQVTGGEDFQFTTRHTENTKYRRESLSPANKVAPWIF